MKKILFLFAMVLTMTVISSCDSEPTLSEFMIGEWHETTANVDALFNLTVSESSIKLELQGEFVVMDYTVDEGLSVVTAYYEGETDVITVEWDPGNPNHMRWVFSDGLTVDFARTE